MCDHQPAAAGEQRASATGRTRTIIVGYGNEMRSDDGLGRVAARRLARSLAGQAGVDVLDVHQLTPDLAGVLKAYEHAILIDARTGEQPGEIYEQTVAPLTHLAQPFSHYVSPGELLAVTQGLYGVQPQMFLLGITAASFAVGRELSPPVAAALPHLLARIRTRIGL